MMPDSSVPTIAALLAAGRTRLAGEDAAREAELLLGHVLGRSRAQLFAFSDTRVDADAAAAYARLIERRAQGEPVAYLLGRQGFWSLDLEVDPATLIPRPETELLVECALARLPAERGCAVADLGTGSGAIALALARERPQARIVAVDASAAALAIAQRNAQRLRLPNIDFIHGDWLAPLAGRRFALIASNPPYLADDDPHLGQGDLRFEPRSALACGRDGLDAIRRIIAMAPAHLAPEGWLLLEHGYRQGAAVRELLAEHGFLDIATELDLEQRERVSLGRWPG